MDYPKRHVLMFIVQRKEKLEGVKLMTWLDYSGCKVKARSEENPNKGKEKGKSGIDGIRKLHAE